jgi:crotonobetainyl-CoA:carnitine CoA-transferase CaiB-like acyl-CoA transferase
MSMALEGIRVVDASEAGFGPACSRVLGDMGAEVIKVERTEGGDQGRGVVKIAGAIPVSDINYLFEFYNCNKKGVALDLKQEKGREALYKLVEKSDVFVCNYRPDALKKLGLEYKTLSKINPRIIYTHISGYGLWGPESFKGAYDYAAFWARTGVMAALGEPDTALSSQMPAYGDNISGLFAACATVIALFHRERTGEGQEVVSSLLGGGIWAMGLVLSAVMATGMDLDRVSRKKAGNPLYNSYECKDGKWVQLVCLQGDKFWHGVCQALGIENLENDPRFSSHIKRMKNNEALISILDQVFASRDRVEWGKRLDERDLLWGSVSTPAEVVADPTAWANGYFQEVDHPTLGRYKMVLPPWQFSKTPPKIKTTAPELGQHTEEVLVDLLGYTWDDLAAFKDKGIIL